MTVRFDQDDVVIHYGHVLEVLPALPAKSVQCVVTSPPYFGLRDYGADGQIGLEPTPAEYVDVMVAVFAAAARVLADDGVLWLNLGDSYSGKANGANSYDRHGGSSHRTGEGIIPPRINNTAAAPYKSLLGIPWRVALALIDAGWTLRNDVIWHKPNAMPESVRDRLSNRHEHLFLFTKGPQYRFDLDAIKVPTTGLMPGNSAQGFTAYGEASGVGRDRRFGGNPRSTLLEPHAERNPGDVWSITTKPYPGAHFAVMPHDLARRCILAGCPDGGTVLDPFHGAGTTAMVARRLGRRYVGVEIKAEPTLAFGDAS